ncbi:MAG: amidohydrolase family protein [Candidatus Thorarchaeota archaeon]|nr:MAG: amidohydrolase family protein [Candidatus Thorarchaeota archaeon]
MKEILVKAAEIIIGNGEMLEDASVHVRGNRIADVGPDVKSPNAEVMDFSDRVIMPGIIDTHIHVSHDGQNPDPRESSLFTDEYLAIRGAKLAGQMLQYGITTVADAAARSDVSFAVKQAVEKGIVRGPRVLACGRMITITGGRDRIYGPNEADGIDGVRRATREELGRGADFIKLAATGAISSSRTESFSAQFTLEELRAAAEETHNVGKMAHAHAYGDAGVQNTILSGVDVVVHGHPLSDESIDMMLENKTLLMPTLVTYYESQKHHDDGDLPDYMVRKERELFPLIESGIRNSVKKGVEIVLGSDTGMPYTPFGPSTLMELELLVKMGGMSEMDAIAAGTLNAARSLKIESDTGTIAPGKSADFLILGEDINPVDDITSLQKLGAIEAVFLRGKRVIAE